MARSSWKGREKESPPDDPGPGYPVLVEEFRRKKPEGRRDRDIEKRAGRICSNLRYSKTLRSSAGVGID